MTSELIQAGLLQAQQKKGKRANTKRVAAALTKWAKRDIEQSFRAGRDAYYIGKEHQCAPHLVLELDLRALHTAVRDLRQLLMGPHPPAVVQVIRKPETTAREVINQIRGKIA